MQDDGAAAAASRSQLASPATSAKQGQRAKETGQGLDEVHKLAIECRSGGKMVNRALL